MRRLGIGLFAVMCAVAMPALMVHAQSRPVAAANQSDTTLIADRVTARPDGVLVAEGNVEILANGQILRASRVVFDDATGALQLDGPIVITDGPDTVILADEAELTDEFRNGLIRSARMVIDQKMQIAAAEINRVNDRYTQLHRTVASSCTVCANAPVPLWQVRAKRIIHDQQERQLYFENATLEIGSVPVLYLPRLRLPDPTLRRASGFLVPTLRYSSTIGTGLQIPYFWTINDHSDVTVTPYLTSGGAKTIELVYRQAFRSGEVQISAAATQDNVMPETRGFFRAQGRFDLPRDFTLSFDLGRVSDAGYSRDYGLANSSTKDSTLSVSRYERDQLIETNVTYYAPYFVSTGATTEARIVADSELIQRFTPAGLGGTAEARLYAFGQVRDFANTGILRDQPRVLADLSWERSWVGPVGLVGKLRTELGADMYSSGTTGLAGSRQSRIVPPRVGAELRWPLMAQTASATHFLEPVVQLVWSDDDPRTDTNEDSLLVELDETNLFSFNRFPGRDRTEQGLRANLGVTWTRTSHLGWAMGVTVGRIISNAPHPDAAPSSGISTRLSDWLTTVHLDLTNGLKLTNRAQYTDSFLVNKNALELAWTAQDWNLASTYTWLRPDPAIGRPTEASELLLSTGYSFDNDWTAEFSWQYDLSAGSSRNAGLGLSYLADCASVDFTVSREFTSATNLQPSTDFGFQVSLDGFGTNPSARRKTHGCQS